MTEQLFLNGQQVDIKPKSIALTMQIADVGKTEDRNLNYTNSFELPSTSKNLNILKYLGVIGNTSDVVYRPLSAKLIVGGVELVGDGYAIIKSQSEGFKAHIYSGNASLFERIKGKSIKELDTSDFNHVGQPETSWSNTEGAIFPIMQTSSLTLDSASGYDYSVIRGNLQMCFFEHTLFDLILTEAGFTYEGAFLTTTDFKEKVITSDKGFYFESFFTNSTTINPNQYLADIQQDKFLKEIVNRYGLLVYAKADHLLFRTINEVFGDDYSGSIDWSDKYVSKVSESFNIKSLAKTNQCSYQYKNDNKYLDYELVIDRDDLDGNKTFLKSIFTIDEPFDIDGIELFNCRMLTTSPIDGIKINPRLFTLSRNTRNIDYTFGTDFNGTVAECSVDRLNFNYLLFKNYESFVSTMARGTRCDILLNLSIIDVVTFDFFRLKYFRQEGAHFFVNKISNFKIGELSKVECIKVDREYDHDYDVGILQYPQPPILNVTSPITTQADPGNASFEAFFTVFPPTDPQSLAVTLDIELVQFNTPYNSTTELNYFSIVDLSAQSKKLLKNGVVAGDFRGDYTVRVTATNSLDLSTSKDVKIFIT